MNPFSKIISLKKIDFSELDFRAPGLWPNELRGLLILSIFILSIIAGFFGHLESQRIVLKRNISQELELRGEFKKKASQVSNIEIYRVQMADMEKIFSDLVGQLPSATEVPSLLDDVTQRGVINGLRITSIDLQEEKSKEFYIELPIRIKAEGGYHDLGAFVSGLAALPRIVTLHNFSISTLDIKSGLLGMTLEVKTYRYKFGDIN